MHRCTDDEFDWIRTGRAEPLSHDDPNWKCLVSNLIPNQFEAYAKILHQVDASYENIDHPLTEREIVILKIPPCTKLRSFVENLRKDGRGPRIKWRALAQLFGVPFESQICHEWSRTTMEEPGCWPRFLRGPDEGNLNARELSDVFSVLRPFTGNQDCHFRFARQPLKESDWDFVFRGAMEDIPTFLRDNKYQFTPEYWWPTNRTWCLCSEYDLKFTLLAGSNDLISAVLNSTTLEALEVNPQTRIDDSAPLPL
jgi:hypothetical protein